MEKAHPIKHDDGVTSGMSIFKQDEPRESVPLIKRELFGISRNRPKKTIVIKKFIYITIFAWFDSMFFSNDQNDLIA